MNEKQERRADDLISRIMVVGVILLFLLTLMLLGVRNYALEGERDLGPAISYTPKSSAQVLEKIRANQTVNPKDTVDADGQPLANSDQLGDTNSSVPNRTEGK